MPTLTESMRSGLVGDSRAAGGRGLPGSDTGSRGLVLRPHPLMLLLLVCSLFLLAPTWAQDEADSTCSASCELLSCEAGAAPTLTLDDGADTLTVSCQPCTDNTFKNSTGSQSCSACGKDGSGKVDLVSEAGATLCTCPVNFYSDSGSSDSTFTCQACTDGVDCSTAGASVDRFTLKSGFWRLEDDVAEVYECHLPSACVGGNGSLGAVVPDDPYCSLGYEGPLCAVCSDGYYPVSGAYECEACTGANKAHVLITILVFGGVLLAFVLLMLKKAEVENPADEAIEGGGQSEGGQGAESAAATDLSLTMDRLKTRTAKAIRWWEAAAANIKKKADTLMVKFKILVTHFQIISAFPLVLDVAWPKTFASFADAFSVFNLNIWGLLSGGCFFSADFYKGLLFDTLLPLLIVAILFGVFYIKEVLRPRRRGQEVDKKEAGYVSNWNGTMAGALLTSFFFYVQSSTTVMQAFNCETFMDRKGDKQSFLVADYSKDCDTTTYSIYFWYSILMVITIPLGIPVVYALLIRRDISRISPKVESVEIALALREDDPRTQRTRFLWSTYHPGAAFFECWECIRKLMLTGLLVYFRPDTPSQVVIAMLLALLSMRVLAQYTPYKRSDENDLAESALWVTFLTLFGGLLIKSGVTAADGYSEAGLGVFLALLNLSLIALAALQTFYSARLWVCDKLGIDVEKITLEKKLRDIGTTLMPVRDYDDEDEYHQRVTQKTKEFREIAEQALCREAELKRKRLAKEAGEGGEDEDGEGLPGKGGDKDGTRGMFANLARPFSAALASRKKGSKGERASSSDGPQQKQKHKHKQEGEEGTGQEKVAKKRSKNKSASVMGEDAAAAESAAAAVGEAVGPVDRREAEAPAGAAGSSPPSSIYSAGAYKRRPLPTPSGSAPSLPPPPSYHQVMTEDPGASKRHSKRQERPSREERKIEEALSPGLSKGTREGRAGQQPQRQARSRSPVSAVSHPMRRGPGSGSGKGQPPPMAAHFEASPVQSPSAVPPTATSATAVPRGRASEGRGRDKGASDGATEENRLRPSRSPSPMY